MLDQFHPAVAAWFRAELGEPTPAQQQAWAAIASGRHTLVAAPTGSGKTLAAFLAAIDELVREGLTGTLADEVAVVYVSPLKALSNDIERNLQRPLTGIARELDRLGLPAVDLRVAVRTGDTEGRARQQMLRRPPHLLVTTPESLYVLLGSEGGRRLLGSARSVIVDEIHAVAASKRGSHLALSLQRLDALCGRALTRIGLSATQKPVSVMAEFLVGAQAGATEAGAPSASSAPAAPGPASPRDCAIVDIGYSRRRDLAIELPATALGAVMSGDMWEQVYRRIAALAQTRTSTLLFVNTRRMAERAARHLGELLGRESVAAHHGSLSREARLDAEQRFKAGDLKLLIATASMELGIDVGDVSLVCQIGSPRGIAAFLQRVGRSGHSVGGVPCGRLFPESRDDLVECAALLDAVRRGELDAVRIPEAPIDVLAQQIVAEVACQDWEEGALFECLCAAHPYRSLDRERFEAVLQMLAEGYTTRRGPRGVHLHRDAVHGILRARRGARLTALTSGGTIPDTGDYTVLLEPESLTIGSVNEDFAIESMAGDIFQLGNLSYRILRVESGRVRVEDAKGAPPSIPFWLGEAAGRSDELSRAVSRLRTEVASRLPAHFEGAGQPADPTAPLGAAQGAFDWLTGEAGLPAEAARQLVDYLARSRHALGTLPTHDHIVLERFFDESGATQLVIHSPFGSRINRAWGLALRKRFCRSFNFELQAAAIEDAIILSLSTRHSFELAGVARYLHPATALDVLTQAVLDAPLFGARWRWAATTALALPRFLGGRKVAAPLQRMRSEDLLATVFPDQVACAENLVGDREVPDHPLVAQTLDDCLHEAMDADGWLAVLRGIEAGTIRVSACESTSPSPMASAVLHARPYAFLDDAPLEERRTRAVLERRHGDPQGPDDMGRLDPQAIADVRAECAPAPRGVEDLHATLLDTGWLTVAEALAEPAWTSWLSTLAEQGRATCLDGRWWVCAERLTQALAARGADPLDPTRLAPPIAAPTRLRGPNWDAREAGPALVELVRARLSRCGPITAEAFAVDAGLGQAMIEAALVQLEVEGHVMRGRFSDPASNGVEWCERHLLARIHRYTLHRLRREIEPVAPRDFMRFLFEWQHVAPDQRLQGPDAVAAIIQQLEGFEAPAAAWEHDLLAARIADYSGPWLDDLCTSGRVTWSRLHGPGSGADGEARSLNTVRSTSICLLPRRALALWRGLAAEADEGGPAASSGGGVRPIPSPGAADLIALSSAADSIPPPDGMRSPASDAAAGSSQTASAGLPARTARVVDWLARHGASYFDDLLAGAGLLRSELEDALADGVARGRLHCDSFAGLRALLSRSGRSRGRARQPRARARIAAWTLGAMGGLGDSGRWALSPARAPLRGTAREEALEAVVRVLLRRYGVITWRLLDREADWLPRWRELSRVCQRLEARGEIRGGRFIDGLSGEQFALPEAVAMLRRQRHRPRGAETVVIPATDPLNLVGIVLSGARVPRQGGARILFEDGIAQAWLVAGEVSFAGSPAPAQAQAWRQALIRSGASASAVAAPESGP